MHFYGVMILKPQRNLKWKLYKVFSLTSTRINRNVLFSKAKIIFLNNFDIAVKGDKYLASDV